MKILRKNDNFKKMPDSNINDVVEIKAMIDYGWKYCSKREYKDFFSKPKEKSNEQESNSNTVESTQKSEKKERKKKQK